MNLHTTNYFNTFILISEDSRAISGETPFIKGAVPTAAVIQFDMIRKNPYQYTSDDVLFQVYAQKNDLTRSAYKAAREQFFSKGQPCMRASPLTKRYGWGIHYDAAGKIAIYGAETPEYERFSKDKSLKVIRAMRSSR